MIGDKLIISKQIKPVKPPSSQLIEQNFRKNLTGNY
jgi:hypothetical protein